ncbi:MAG: helix-turn-helix transcriptional regulator [Streptosporangiaceae bacterium]
MANPEPDYLTLLEVAERYRTTEATVRYWRHTGYGPRGIRLGTRVLYPRAEIELFDRRLADGAAVGDKALA